MRDGSDSQRKTGIGSGPLHRRRKTLCAGAGALRGSVEKTFSAFGFRSVAGVSVSLLTFPRSRLSRLFLPLPARRFQHENTGKEAPADAVREKTMRRSGDRSSRGFAVSVRSGDGVPGIVPVSTSFSPVRCRSFGFLLPLGSFGCRVGPSVCRFQGTGVSPARTRNGRRVPCGWRGRPSRAICRTAGRTCGRSPFCRRA